MRWPHVSCCPFGIFQADCMVEGFFGYLPSWFAQVVTESSTVQELSRQANPRPVSIRAKWKSNSCWSSGPTGPVCGNAHSESHALLVVKALITRKRRRKHAENAKKKTAKQPATACQRLSTALARHRCCFQTKSECAPSRIATCSCSS